MNHSVRRISDGAMMTAVAGVMILLNRMSAGFLEGFLIYAYPLPLVFYGAKYGWKAGWTAYAAMVLLAFILSTPSSLIIAAGQFFIGLVYGAGIHSHTSTDRLILRTLLLSMIASVLQMVVFASFFGYNNEADITETENMIHSLLAQSGAQLPASLDLHGFLRRMLVIVAAASGILDGAVIHLLSSMMLKRLHFEVNGHTHLRDYYPPKWSGYAALAGLVGYYASMNGLIHNQTVNGIVQGAGIIGVLWLAFFGMTAMALMLENMAHMKKAGAVILSVLFGMIVSLAVDIMGFLYITSDYHERILKGGKQNASENE